MSKKCGFLGGKEAIQSLRSSGYKDTSMALGELIDNSIQAGAKNVSVVLTCEKIKGSRRTTMRIVEMAVIDDGHGMNEDVLQSSLVLGEGTNRNEPQGMGKYGVGLPQSSISQCKRVDAWSWIKKGFPRHVYIDLDDESWLNDAEIKSPDDFPVPNYYQKYADSNTGTIIRWSNIDRISWKKANTAFDKCENQIGRMYRHWLHRGDVKIKMVTIDSTGNELTSDYFRAVDPLFLMEDAKCGTPPDTPMFKHYIDPKNMKYTIMVDGEEKELSVKLTFTIAKDEVRLAEDIDSPGSKDFGKIAKECTGVSIVREGRELELSTQWNNMDKDPRHRWWGAEISFSRDCDDIFGVTNNKQSATRLNELAKKGYYEIMEDFDIDTEGEPDRDKKRLREESPEDYILMDVVTTVQSVIKQMGDNIKTKTKKSKRDQSTRHDDSPVKEKYGQLVEKRSKEISTQSETDILMSGIEDRLPGVRAELEKDVDYSESDKELIIEDVKNGHPCSIVATPQDSSAFFNIKREDTQIVVNLNTNHPMYDYLFGKFDDIINGNSNDVDDIIIKSKDALNTLEFLLAAWARMEDEDRDPKMKTRYRSIRNKWGEILEDSYSDN